MPTPVLVGLSVLNVKGFRMGTSGIYDFGRPIDRNHLILPGRLAESLTWTLRRSFGPASTRSGTLAAMIGA